MELEIDKSQKQPDKDKDKKEAWKTSLEIHRVWECPEIMGQVSEA